MRATARVTRTNPGAFDKYGKKVVDAVKREVARGAANVRNDAARSIQSAPRGGEAYVRYNPNRTGRASAPGEPPATDTGFLVSNISFQIGFDGLSADIISQAPYSTDLEFGTSKMGARPFLVPALEENKPKITMRINNAVKRAGGR
ncbi:MAG: HK97-gp10 family putative phage morphogenesis protein [Betaproteobacteria bacterium]